MFPLNTIIAWNINIIRNKKYDNKNIIIASRAYFLQRLTQTSLARSSGFSMEGDVPLLAGFRRRKLTPARGDWNGS
jgi:hypothetical protein